MESLASRGDVDYKMGSAACRVGGGARGPRPELRGSHAGSSLVRRRSKPEGKGTCSDCAVFGLGQIEARTAEHVETRAIPRLSLFEVVYVVDCELLIPALLLFQQSSIT